MSYKKAALGFQVKFGPKTKKFYALDAKQRVIYSDSSQSKVLSYTHSARKSRVKTRIFSKSKKGKLQVEKNDCVVVGYANFFKLTYRQAHSCLKAFGRLDKKGTPSCITLDLLKHGGAKRVNLKEITYLGELPKLYPKGRYFIFVLGHVTVMVNGTFYDQWEQFYYEFVMEIYTI